MGQCTKKLYNPPGMLDAFVLLIGIALLLTGGHWLVLGSVTIARRLGVSTLVVGLTIVAMGTSAPELAFNVIAATAGHTDLSFGNIIGSNIANIGLILASPALFREGFPNWEKFEPFIDPKISSSFWRRVTASGS